MHPRQIKSNLHLGLALLAGLTLAACGKNLNVDSLARTSSAMQDTAALYGWTNHYARLVVDRQKPNNDVALLIKVKSALVREPDLKRFALDVGVLNGVVTLYGEVDTTERRAKAERVARDVQGVEAVKSGISLLQRA